MKNGLRVVVVGGGLAGLTAAAYAARAGYGVTVIEKVCDSEVTAAGGMENYTGSIDVYVKCSEAHA